MTPEHWSCDMEGLYWSAPGQSCQHVSNMAIPLCPWCIWTAATAASTSQDGRKSAYKPPYLRFPSQVISICTTVEKPKVCDGLETWFQMFCEKVHAESRSRLPWTSGFRIVRNQVFVAKDMRFAVLCHGNRGWQTDFLTLFRNMAWIQNVVACGDSHRVLCPCDKNFRCKKAFFFSRSNPRRPKVHAPPVHTAMWSSEEEVGSVQQNSEKCQKVETQAAGEQRCGGS